MTGGEIDHDLQRARRLVNRFPHSKIAAGFANHPMIDEGHEPGIFGGREKLLWRDEALLGMLPAQQSFKGDDLARMNLEDGLVEHSELAAFEGGAQVGLEFKASDSALMHRGVEEF